MSNGTPDDTNPLATLGIMAALIAPNWSRIVDIDLEKVAQFTLALQAEITEKKQEADAQKAQTQAGVAPAASGHSTTSTTTPAGTTTTSTAPKKW